MPKPRFVLSYGGGVNSAALMVLLLRRRRRLDEVVFADTGGELPETYQYIKLVRQFLSDRGIPFTTVAARVSGTDLYTTSLRRKVIPSALWRWCTRDFKVDPIHRHYETLGIRINQYLAIAYDEFYRMKDSTHPLVRNLYPLVELKVTREDCLTLIRDAGLPVPIKSACFFCPFGSVGRWEYIFRRHPELYEKAMVLEETSKHFPQQRLVDQAYRRKTNLTLRELRHRFERNEDVPDGLEESPCGAECLT